MSAQTKALLLSLAICIACQPAAKKPPPAKPAASGPTIRAIVITIRTNQQPEKRTLTQTLVIAGDRARDTGEHDVWRLYDTKANTVTFVDDLARTFRTESLQTLIAQRRTVMKGALPPHYPRARLVHPGTKKAIQGVNAELLAIENGAYKRELWLGEHPSIPPGLFAMMYASDPPTLPLAPMMRDVDEALTATRAFPLADRAEVPVAKDKLVIDRAVVSVGTGDVAQSLLTIPKGYRDVTVKKKP